MPTNAKSVCRWVKERACWLVESWTHGLRPHPPLWPQGTSVALRGLGGSPQRNQGLASTSCVASQGFEAETWLLSSVGSPEAQPANRLRWRRPAHRQRENQKVGRGQHPSRAQSQTREHRTPCRVCSCVVAPEICLESLQFLCEPQLPSVFLIDGAPNPQPVSHKVSVLWQTGQSLRFRDSPAKSLGVLRASPPGVGVL